MKRTSSRFRWTLCAFVLLLLAGLPQSALACGYACVPLPWDQSCSACQYVGGEGSGGCVQVAACGCYEILCGFVQIPEETAAAILGFSPEDTQPADVCTDAPVAAQGAALVG